MIALNFAMNAASAASSGPRRRLSQDWLRGGSAGVGQGGASRSGECAQGSACSGDGAGTTSGASVGAANHPLVCSITISVAGRGAVSAALISFFGAGTPVLDRRAGLYSPTYITPGDDWLRRGRIRGGGCESRSREAS